MNKIAIISSSVRDGRLSHRVALFLKQLVEEKYSHSVDFLDLKEYNFPLFNERYAFQEEPITNLVDFTDRFNNADAVIIVSPVYNANFPASLKNVIDLYYKEWQRKVVGIVSVTYGTTPGIATVLEIQNLLFKMGAIVAPRLYTVINTENEFNEDGVAVNREYSEGLAHPMLNELFWLVDKLNNHLLS